MKYETTHAPISVLTSIYCMPTVTCYNCTTFIINLEVRFHIFVKTDWRFIYAKK